jgi:hypothetical protein
LSFIPVDSTKHSFSALVTQKQIDALTTNQLRLYFTSWCREQHYSLSGFLHLNTHLDLDDILHNTHVTEWLSIFQYSIKLCKSQDEEMSLISALCYGSLFLYREDLLLNIIAHPLWVALNQDRDKPIVLDLVIKPFRGSSKSTEMIFVRSE